MDIDKKELTEEELETYSRQIVYRHIGYTGQLKLRNAKVCIVGLGGLGSPIATQLTAMGVGYLRLIDRDVVERSNLHRQHLYDVSSVGYPKVEVAAKKLRMLNPDVNFEPFPVSLNAENALKLIDGVDVVLDGLDSIETRYLINRICVKLKIPYVFGAAIMDYGNLSTIIPGETPCLECFYPNMKDKMFPKCSVAGVHPSVLGMVSSLQISEAIKILLGKKPYLTGKLLYVDLTNMSLNEIDIAQINNCPVCGVDPVMSPLLIQQKFIEEMCGRGGKKTFIITPKENLELNLDNLYKSFCEQGVRIEVKADLGLSVSYRKGITLNILTSGIMIAKGLHNADDVLKIYSKEIVNNLKIPWSRIR